MNLLYEVIKPCRQPSLNKGFLLGYVRYNTTSDLWGDEIYLDQKLETLRGAYTCSNQYHGRQMVLLCRDDESVMEMQYCHICECLVTPPFDGYVYHDYGCQMDQTCVCDHPPEGPEMKPFVVIDEVKDICMEDVDKLRPNPKFESFLEGHGYEPGDWWKISLPWCTRLRKTLFALTIGAKP